MTVDPGGDPVAVPGSEDGLAISIQDVRKVYGAADALAGVTLDVRRGEVFGYVGPNGAGKTTTLKILAGLIQPTSGRVEVAGVDVRERPLEAKARVGYVPESGALFEKLSAREYLTLTGRLYALEEPRIAARVAHWLAFFGLSARADEPLANLSKGLKQRVCWMAALLHDPDVLILDEPLNGLDVETVARVKDLMAELAADGRTVFYSSHLIDIVGLVCTRVAVLHRGRVLAVGPVPEVQAALGASSLEDALLGLSRETS
jgi:ABC-2 type transport system ATP-binding protein